MDSFKPPLGMQDADWSNPLGTDNQGRDVLPPSCTACASA